MVDGGPCFSPLPNCLVKISFTRRPAFAQEQPAEKLPHPSTCRVTRGRNFPIFTDRSPIRTGWFRPQTVLLGLLSCVYITAHAAKDETGALQQPSPLALTLQSPAFKSGESIPDRFTAAVPNSVSPPLDWGNVPAGTQSFVLFLIDKGLDSQSAKAGFTHWIIFDIPAGAKGLPEALPALPQLEDGTIQWKNTKNRFGYHNPGAPFGPDHFYVFRIFALNRRLGLEPAATREEIERAMEGHVLGKAELVGRFHKPAPPTSP